MIKAMTHQILEGLQQQCRQRLLIFFMNFEHLLRGDQRFFPLRIAYFGEDDALSECETKTDA